MGNVLNVNNVDNAPNDQLATMTLMTNNASTLPRRYPGLKPFERSQSTVFHGRGDDIKRLTDLVLRERLVVLFSKSGIGKTSLLQAGVAPELERQDFIPVFLRSERTEAPLLETLADTLSKSPQVSGYDRTAELAVGIEPLANGNQQPTANGPAPTVNGQQPTFWEQMKRLEFDVNGLPATPVLVFDQFEELFTLAHSEHSRHQFLSELADLANETMPSALRSDLLRRFQEGDPAVTVETMQWWERQPEVRIVLSIRSDFLHLLDQISTQIPGILRNRYQLQPLNRDKARVAIVQPALAEGEYASPTFEYSDAALDQMIDFLTGKAIGEKTTLDGDDAQVFRQRDEIESVNLQIICQDIEEKIIEQQIPDECFNVLPEFYGKAEGLQASLRNFYRNQLDIFPKAYVERILQKTARSLPITDHDRLLSTQPTAQLTAIAQRIVEESLVTPGNRRNSVVDDTLIDEYRVTADFLDTLVDRSRLLRKEPRLDDFYYEISHDTLLPAIIESRNNRRLLEKTDQDRALLEKQLATEAESRKLMEAELKDAKDKRRLADRAAKASFLATLLSLAMGAFFIYSYINDVKNEFRQAEHNVEIEQYDAALVTYNKFNNLRRRRWVIANLMSPSKTVSEELAVVQQFHLVYDSLVGHQALGDSLFFIQDKEYAAALHSYNLAQNLLVRYETLNQTLLHHEQPPRPRVSPTHLAEHRNTLQLRIENAREALITRFSLCQRDLETFTEAGAKGQMQRNLRMMDRLWPKDQVDVDDLIQRLGTGPGLREYITEELEKLK